MTMVCVLLQACQNWSLQDCAELSCGLSEQLRSGQKTWAEHVCQKIAACQGYVGVSCELPAAARRSESMRRALRVMITENDELSDYNYCLQ